MKYNKLFITLVVTITLIFICSCAKNPIVKPPPGILSADDIVGMKSMFQVKMNANI